ncbi:class I SAM-dependent methyltransferase [Natronococcus wangiae]|uniref:class I SAM-dependent methyltransferase n=1 Tax=Natronococcus wangiae TaxID=3068275 RepID=UPI00273D289A|nr:class I SAM-dependent methyltransferase [Natronococcus sp. AD5]
MAMLGGVLDGMFSRPSGVLGRIGGALMARTNDDVAAQVVDALDLNTTDSALEVGFGPGPGIERAAGVVADGRVAGVDYSETMVDRARRRNAGTIDAGRVDLRYGSVEALPFDDDDAFDDAFSINSLHVWPDRRAGLREIRRVLRPGGTVIVALTPHAGRPDDLDHLLRDAEFEDVRRLTGIDADCVAGRTPRRE